LDQQLNAHSSSSNNKHRFKLLMLFWFLLGYSSNAYNRHHTQTLLFGHAHAEQYDADSSVHLSFPSWHDIPPCMLCFLTSYLKGFSVIFYGQKIDLILMALGTFVSRRNKFRPTRLSICLNASFTFK